MYKFLEIMLITIIFIFLIYWVSIMDTQISELESMLKDVYEDKIKQQDSIDYYDKWIKNNLV